MSQIKLESLFRRCDKKGSGFIDGEDFRELCKGFEIEAEDADIIFMDLDHDGDGKISFEDFSFGFRDFLTPGARRGSVQLTLDYGAAKGSPLVRENSIRILGDAYRQPFEERLTIEEMGIKQKEMERRHNKARDAWGHLTQNIGKKDVRKFLSSSGDKLLSLYEELQTSDQTHLVDHFEEVMSALMTDVRKMDVENRKMEEKIIRERETHTAHLKDMEAELDAQVAKIENKAQQQARSEYDFEKRELQTKMENELAQLQSQLVLFQKVDSWLNKEKGGQHSQATQEKLETAVMENWSLKTSLGETQTNIALLKAEMDHLKSQYQYKCSELNMEREDKMEYVYEFDNIKRQLELLRGANQRLQDTNDGLREILEVPGGRSPVSESCRVLPPSVDEQPRSLGSLPAHSKRPNCRMVRSASRPSSDYGGGYDSDSLRSKDSRGSAGRLKAADIQFGLRRFMDDLDSGNSTMPGDENYRDTSPDLDMDASRAIRMLDAVVTQQQVQQDAGTPRNNDKDQEVSEEEGETPEELEVRDQLSDLKPVQGGGGGGVAPPESDSVVPFPAPRKSSITKRPLARVCSLTGHLVARDLEPTGQPDRTYKVVFAGDAAVGKTSFINRITKGIFVENLSSTLGVDFQVKTFYIDERNIALQLWDTAGQERFRSVTRSYFRRADGVMLLYDVTNEKSFMSVREWVNAVDDVADKRIPIMLCANKCDLREAYQKKGLRVVQTESGERMAREHQAIYIETSSVDGQNILEALVQLSRDMRVSEDTEVSVSAMRLEKERGKKTNCCNTSK